MLLNTVYLLYSSLYFLQDHHIGLIQSHPAAFGMISSREFIDMYRREIVESDDVEKGKLSNEKNIPVILTED